MKLSHKLMMGVLAFMTVISLVYGRVQQGVAVKAQHEAIQAVELAAKHKKLADQASSEAEMAKVLAEKNAELARKQLQALMDCQKK